MKIQHLPAHQAKFMVLADALLRASAPSSNLLVSSTNNHVHTHVNMGWGNGKKTLCCIKWSADCEKEASHHSNLYKQIWVWQIWPHNDLMFVIPQSMHQDSLQRIHEGHLGGMWKEGQRIGQVLIWTSRKWQENVTQVSKPHHKQIKEPMLITELPKKVRTHLFWMLRTIITTACHHTQERLVWVWVTTDPSIVLNSGSLLNHVDFNSTSSPLYPQVNGLETTDCKKTVEKGKRRADWSLTDGGPGVRCIPCWAPHRSQQRRRQQRTDQRIRMRMKLKVEHRDQNLSTKWNWVSWFLDQKGGKWMRVQEKQEDTAEDSGGHLKDTLMRQSPEGRLLKHLTCTVMWFLHLLQQLKHQQHQTLESSRKT